LGNGNNLVFLTGSSNSVFDGSGTDAISAGTGNDTFVLNAAGGADTIDNFNATDHLDLQSLLAGLGLTPTVDGLAGNITVTEQADSSFGPGGVDTLITVAGAGGTAHVALQNYDAGGLAGLLSQNSLVLPS
jgi:hypothetical protein